MKLGGLLSGLLALLPEPVGAVERPFTVEANSSNPKLIPAANIFLEGAGVNRAVRLTPALAQFGAAAITLTVINAGHNRSASSFLVSVVGHLQALVDATVAGTTLSLPTSTCLDSVTIKKDLSLEGIDARQQERRRWRRRGR